MKKNIIMLVLCFGTASTTVEAQQCASGVCIVAATIVAATIVAGSIVAFNDIVDDDIIECRGEASPPPPAPAQATQAIKMSCTKDE